MSELFPAVHDPGPTRDERLGAAAIALGAAVTAGLYLVRHFTGAPVPSLNEIPAREQGAAAALCLLGLALAAQQTRLPPVWQRVVSAVIAGIGLLNAGFALADLLQISSPRWIPNLSAGIAGGIALVALLQLACRLLPRPRWHSTCLLGSLMLFGAGGVIALTGASGLPLLSMDGTVLIPFWIGSVLMALCAATALSIGMQRLPHSAAHAGSSEWRPQAWLLWATLLAGGGVAFGSYAYLRLHYRQVSTTIEATLSSLADLQAGQLAAWRHERIADAALLMQAPYLADEVPALLSGQGSQIDRQRWTTYFEQFRRSYGYHSATLYDVTGRPLYSSPPAAALEGDPAPWARATQQANDALVRDLYRDRNRGIWIEFWAPIRDPENNQPQAVLRLRVDARTHLFPLIKSWPLPNVSAESLLLRRDGDQLLALNELRFEVDSALRSSRLVSERQLLGVKALLSSWLPLTAGIDYRGQSVVGVARPVEGTAWVLVAKIDRAEAFAPVRREGWRVALVLTGLCALAGLLLSRFLRRQRARQEVAERDRRAALERLGLVLRNANDVVLLLDESQRIIEASERSLAVYGWPPAEIAGRHAADLRVADAPGAVDESLATLPDTGRVFTTIHRRKDGTTFPVEISARPVRIEGRTQILAIIRDITQRRDHEREIEQLNRLYQVLSRVNSALVHRQERASLFDRVCRAFVEEGGFKAAWIGWHDPTLEEIVPQCVAGGTRELVANLHSSTDAALPTGRGPCGTAFREARIVVCNDVATDPSTAPWRDQVLQIGIHSAVALPLAPHGTVQGVLAIYDTRIDSFGPREIALFEEAARDISFGIEVLDSEAARLAVEEELRRSELQYRNLFESMDLGVVYHDATCRPTSANASALRILGLTLEQLVDPGIRPEGWRTTREDGSDFPREEHPIATALHTGQPVSGAIVGVVPATGAEVRWVLINAVPEFRPGEDKPFRGFTVFADISERIHVAAALQETQERYRLVAENTEDVIWLYDLTTHRFAYQSPSLARVLDLDPDELNQLTLETLFAPESLARLRQEFQQRIADFTAGDDAARIGVLYAEQLRHDGTTIPTEIVATLLTDEHGQPTRILGVSRDITERQRASDELRRSRDRLAKAEQIVHLGNWEYDAARRESLLSDEVYRIFEYEPAAGADALFDRFMDRVHPEDRDRVTRAINEAVQHQGRYNFGHRLLLPDGRIKYVECSGELVAGPDGRLAHAVGTVQDVTERKLVEFELHELVKVLRAVHVITLTTEQRQLSVADLISTIVRQLPSGMRVPRLAQAEITVGAHKAQAGAEGARTIEAYAPITVNGEIAGRVIVGYMHRPDAATEACTVQEHEFVESVARTIGLALGERESYEQMRRSEERFRAIFDHAAVGMFETTPGGRITRANPFLAELLGEAAAAWVGRHWTEFVAGDDVAPDTPPPTAPRELHCKRREGRPFWGLVSSKIERNADGQALGHICLLQDISAQVTARQTLMRFTSELEAQVRQRTAELDARNREVQGLLQANPDLVLRLRTDGTILTVQRAQGAQRLASIDTNLTRGGSGVLYDLASRSVEIGRRAVTEGTTHSVEASVPLPDGECFVELRAAPVGSDNFVVYVRDISARRRLEEETAAMLEKERQVSEMKTRFISVTSHEFRTPMSAAMGSAELLANHLDRLAPAKRTELLSRISQSLRRMTDMLDDVLTLNRMDAGRTQVRFVPVDLRAFLQSVIDEIKLGDRDAHPIDFRPHGTPEDFISDTNLLHHIFSNLLSNAVRYSPAQAPIHVSLELRGTLVSVTVQDHGIGIPPADRARIFEPFERGSNVGTINGTGLGLNIVRRMTELLGGTISVDSETGRGSSFHVTLPRTPPDRPQS
ncbi:PAS domain S-box protein [Opitutus sp. ER46]|uniref:PAS domain S-box protein n=1 Tax=Opitutus sp. ER46 TaxID=2161864 RepID=UPI000D2F692E|nr:PAS domain S-box protein [Opitutus sp. ER46]PTX92359.1 hypothetical protein DB354_13555 [Opitutus sp. ER46]